MNVSIDKLFHLIRLHLSDLDKNDRSWYIKNSPLGGRGLFADRNIAVGEVIFRERPLLRGPAGRQQQQHRWNCVVCYKSLDSRNSACKNGCSLPVCDSCTYSNEHLLECELYKSWKPIDPHSVSYQSVRILTIVRGIFLENNQRELIYALQANDYPNCRLEISNAAKCFNNFPNDNETISYFCRLSFVLNSVAFEAVHDEGENDISVKGLYPLAGLMNHECTPNTCHLFEKDNTIIVKASRFISKGSEILTTYSKLLWSNLSRRVFLNLTKQFTCFCKRCCDPTENGIYLCGLLCREKCCQGIVIPEETANIESPWKCLKCHRIYDSKNMFKIQDFTLAAINSKVKSDSVKDLISFINEKIPRFAPATNQFVVEAKLNVIWRMKKSEEKLTEQDYRDKNRFCEEILDILEKLKAGECTIKMLIQDEMNRVI